MLCMLWLCADDSLMIASCLVILLPTEVQLEPASSAATLCLLLQNHEILDLLGTPLATREKVSARKRHDVSKSHNL